MEEHDEASRNSAVRKSAALRTFVIVGLDVADYVAYAYRDLAKHERVVVARRTRSFVPRLLKKLTTSFKVNRLVRVPLQQLWPRLEFDASGLSEGNEYAFLFFESPEGLNPAYLKHCERKYPGSSFILLMLNPVDANVRCRLERVEDAYDVIVTCNKADAVSRGWVYYPDCYSSAIAPEHGDRRSDVCFVGADKGRAEKIHAVHERLTSAGLVCDFLIVGARGHRREAPGLRYARRMIGYGEYLRRVAGSNCLLEVVAHDADYCTLRTMEAAAYQKKLLTTNRAITREQFFCSDNVMVFREAEDIDPEFARQPYVANGDVSNPFSPLALLEHLESHLDLLATEVASTGHTWPAGCSSSEDQDA